MPTSPSPVAAKMNLWPLYLFTALYMVAAVATSVIQGNREFIFYIVVMVVLIAAVACLHAKVRLTMGLLWALNLWGLAHMAGGLVEVPASWPTQGEHSVLYSLWLIPGRLKYDQIVHAYGFGVVTLIAWHTVSRRLRAHGDQPVLPTFGMLLLCAAVGCGFGAFNEVVEFIAVLTIPNTNVGGYENTGWDLVANLVGTIIAAGLIRVRHGREVER